MNQLIAVFLTCLLSFHSLSLLATEKDSDENKDIEPVKQIDGQGVVSIDEDIQQASGLKTLTLKQVEYQPEFIAYGKAISLSPLLNIRNQLLANTELEKGVKARLNEAENTVSRMRRLHSNDIISTRKLQKQQTQWQSDQAVYNTNRYQSRLIINECQLKWGSTITKWLTDPQSVEFEKLVNGNTTLLKITVPVNRSLSAQTQTVYINPAGDRNSAVTATFVSQLPQIDAISQGYQYLFQIDDPGIKPGMNVSVWIPELSQHRKGVIIPESAIAWHLGVSFVFIKIDEEHFLHKNLTDPVKVLNGYFIAEQLKEGDELVVTGTQMLLSHEFKSQIPDEDDDD